MGIDYSTFAFPKNAHEVKTTKKKVQMKNKTSKLAYKEKKRESILTDNMERCYICGSKKCDLHEIFGGCRRQKSIEHKLVIPICRYDHSNIKNFENWLHKTAQKKFEETHTREEFIKEFGKSFI